jgi:signal transduction histidine kinase/DNA-binding response OmpR family regulator
MLGVSTYDEICSTKAKYIHQDNLQEQLDLNTLMFEKNTESKSVCRLYDCRYNEYRYVSVQRGVIREDETTHYLVTVHDIHEKTLIDIQLRKETTKAEKAYNHKSIFLANMSHEIRTPLNGIIGMLTLLEDTVLSNDQQDYIGMIRECSFNLMTIINDILDYSKLEVGKITLDNKSMNLEECIGSTNDIILSKVYEKSLEYVCNIYPHTPLNIFGDSNRIKQVLLNLLSNAIKFTEKGNILLDIKSISKSEYDTLIKRHTKIKTSSVETDNSIYIRFNITDTGCGIEESDKEKLFKSFSQIDNKLTTKVYQGTGLGLAISKELVELMKGCIWLDWSEIGKGSRFSFVIKASLSEEEIPQVDDDIGILKGINVLILDDTLHNRMSLTGIVNKWGMKAYPVSNSEEALYMAKLIPFDIGLIDICMPKLDGPSFACKLREQTGFNNKTFPLLALSSLGEKVAYTSQYFYSHLIKPIKEHKLKQLCIECISQHSKLASPKLEKHNPIENLHTYMVENSIGELKDNVRILLAEDAYINQRVITSFLHKLGYFNVKVVDNGQQCLDVLLSEDFDIVLLDIRMPLLNGEEVMQRFKSQSVKKMPYMVAVTAYCLREDKDKYMNMGFDYYIPKPISLHQLGTCMNTLIQKMLHE